MTTASRPTTPLLQRMIEDMKIRNLSPHTIKAYVERIAAFAKHFGKSPQLLGQKEVRAYLVFLVEEKRVSWSYYGQAICAIRFLYRVTLGKDWVVKGVVSPKKEMKLPVILSAAEVAQFLGAITSLKHRAILMTAYAAGLRVSEVVALQVADIDSRRTVIRIRQGKGHKDREVMLSPLLGVDAASEPLRAPAERVEGQTAANLCPSCGRGRMVIVEMLRSPPTHQGQETRERTLERAGFDTS
jgi:integrase/recombinase XerD